MKYTLNQKYTLKIKAEHMLLKKNKQNLLNALRMCYFLQVKVCTERVFPEKSTKFKDL